MKSIQTVDIGDLNTMMPQHGSNGEKTHGFGPEIVSSEIMDPGVDEKNVRCVADRHIPQCCINGIKKSVNGLLLLSKF